MSKTCPQGAYILIRHKISKCMYDMSGMTSTRKGSKAREIENDGVETLRFV